MDTKHSKNILADTWSSCDTKLLLFPIDSTIVITYTSDFECVIIMSCNI